jgi:hypothetical protein
LAVLVASVATCLQRAEAPGPAASRICWWRGELAQMLVGEALDLGDAVADLLPADPEAAGQLGAQVGLEDVAGGLGVVVDRRVVEAGPLAVRPLGRIGDQDVDVDLGASGAGGAMAETCGEEA